ncbi:MAG: flagellar type III secretion system pore protein FliP [Cellulomonas sp.]|nr:flagellar type III secretion system pore protein FliP [Cellulomonas sp.]
MWLVPLIGAGVVLLLPKGAERSVKYVATAFTAAAFLLTLVALAIYVSGGAAAAPLAERAARNVLTYQNGAIAVDESRGLGDLVVRRAWMPAFNIQYYLGLDGVSVSLVVLTGLISLLACLASWGIEKQVRGYYSLFLLLVASMTGVFLALDLVLFYVFFEVMLLPMYFLIALWGGEDREYAAIKFLLYTLFGSVFILVAILILYFWPGDVPVAGFAAGTFDLVALTAIASTTAYYGRWIQDWVFVLFLIGFLVKLPSFPFHTWLPDAHVQAPTPISMILAGVLLKVGGYGLVRLAWPLAPAGALDWSSITAAVGVFSIIYGALAAMAQTDFKKLVAYSSISHMGYVTLGMSVMNLAGGAGYYAYGVNGAMYMMLAHGVTSAAMFFLVGVIYDRAHTRDLDQLGGLNDVMPVYGAVSYVIFFGSMGLPGLCGFVAEIFVVLAMTRNALGLQGVPPNQAIAGLALFLSLFVMAPTIGDINTQAVQPYLHGETSFSQAIGAGEKPLATFMVAHTREQDLALVTRAAQRPNPQSAADVPFTTLAPAFMLSELRAAFIMGFVIFVPFLVIDLVVSSSLMAMGMMMLPPVMVSLPFKLLLFVLVDGWGLVIKALLGSYTGAGG